MSAKNTEGRLIASGGVEVHKEHSYAEHKEVQWSVNEPNGVVFNSSSRVLKFELRRSPRNEKIEDVVISWRQRNPSVAAVNVLPTFWNCIDSIRVQLNNTEVVDLKNIYGIKTEWKNQLLTRFKTLEERDYHWNWCCPNLAAPTDKFFSVATGVIQPTLIGAGQFVEFNASFSDILPGVFDGLPWNNLFLCEVEMTLASQERHIGDVPEALDLIHENIEVYSRHKTYTVPPPRPFASHTLYHAEHEVLTVGAGSPLHVLGSGTLVLDLHTFIPRRSLIQRIHVFEQSDAGTPFAYNSWRNIFIGSLLLERNGDEFLGTEHFYRNRNQIAYQTQKYYRRHHGGVGGIFPNPNVGTWGLAVPETFVDCTAVMKTVNISPSTDTKVKASEGIDNMSNLNLTITLNAANFVDGDVVVVVEWLRFDRISPNGQIKMIQNA